MEEKDWEEAVANVKWVKTNKQTPDPKDVEIAKQKRTGKSGAKGGLIDNLPTHCKNARTLMNGDGGRNFKLKDDAPLYTQETLEEYDLVLHPCGLIVNKGVDDVEDFAASEFDDEQGEGRAITLYIPSEIEGESIEDADDEEGLKEP